MQFWHEVTSWAERCPNKPAVISPAGELTFAQLARRAQALARTLSDYAQQRIGILTNDPVTMAVGFHGTASAGKTLVVLDPSWPRALLDSMITTLGCTVVLVSSTDEVAHDLPVSLLALPLNADTHSWLAPLHSDERELLIICTSGTTSRPKAIVRTASSWQASVVIGAPVLMATEEAITLSPGPISHGLGLYSLVESIHTGGTFVGTGRWQLQEVSSLLRRIRCNRVVGVPTILDRLHTLVETELLSNIRWIISGGESLPMALVKRLADLPALESCIEYFGSSEHSLIAYTHRGPHTHSNGSFSGRLFPSVSVHLHEIDPATGVGTVYVDSPFNAIDYDPETAKPMPRCNNSTSIMDRGMLVGDRDITFKRRDDGILNLHGNNIHPSEIADVFLQLNIQESKIRLEHKNGEQFIVAYVLAPVIEREKLKTFFFERLPVFKIPHQVNFLNQWPQSFSGKASIAFVPDNAPEILKGIQLR